MAEVAVLLKNARYKLGCNSKYAQSVRGEIGMNPHKLFRKALNSPETYRPMTFFSLHALWVSNSHRGPAAAITF